MSIEHPSFGKLDDDRIIIFDTTLRDGEQSPGFSMNLNEKIRMAEALTELGVDVLEAGFAIASPGDFEITCQLQRIERNRVHRVHPTVMPGRQSIVTVPTLGCLSLPDELHVTHDLWPASRLSFCPRCCARWRMPARPRPPPST